MTEFIENFSNYLSSELNCDPEDVIEALNNFTVSPASSKTKKSITKKPLKKKTLVKQTPKKKPFVKSKPLEKHICERTPRGKTEQCGKNAKNGVDDDGTMRWYCGTEKSGCYATILKSMVRAKGPASGGAKGPVGGAKPNANANAKAKPNTLVEKKKVANIKSESLVRRITKKNKFDVRKVRKGGKVYWMDFGTRILFDHATEEAYGVLDKKNKERKLNNEEIRLLEAHGLGIKTKSKNSTAASLRKKLSKIKEDESESEEEEEEKSEKEEEDDEDSEKSEEEDEMNDGDDSDMDI